MRIFYQLKHFVDMSVISTKRSENENQKFIMERPYEAIAITSARTKSRRINQTIKARTTAFIKERSIVMVYYMFYLFGGNVGRAIVG